MPIPVKCSCGYAAMIDEVYDNWQSACPKCGKTIRVGSDLGTLWGRRALSRKWVGIICGIMLIATLVMPWSWTAGAAKWSWTVLKDSSAAMATLMIGGWIIGMACLACGIFLRGVPLALGYLVLGGIGTALLAMAAGTENILPQVLLFNTISAEPVNQAIRQAGAESVAVTPFWLKIAAVSCLGCLLVFTSLRVRLGSRIIVCLLQLLASAGTATVLAISVYYGIRAMDRLNMLSTLIMFLMAGVIFVGCVMAFAHAINFRSLGAWQSLVGLACLWLGLAGLVAHAALRSLFEGAGFGSALADIARLMFVFSIALLAVEGVGALVANIVAGLAAAATGAPAGAPNVPMTASGILLRQGQALDGKPADSPAPLRAQLVPAAGTAAPSDIPARLKEMESLRQQGLISQAEFDAKKAELLKQL
ncbi:MAG: SHOCT domain-containing protein [Planctomycetes bacterium]|nr:SHOCT domain-containing protein [Planctomycetota bacterium]